MKSLDPRINRLDVEKTIKAPLTEAHEHWQSFEVFVQKKQGAAHVHEGSLHAPNGQMALVLAKEQFGRRDRCFNIWVVQSADIHQLSEEDADMFANNREKKYRLSNGFKVSDKITAFKNAKKNKV